MFPLLLEPIWIVYTASRTHPFSHHHFTLYACRLTPMFLRQSSKPLPMSQSESATSRSSISDSDPTSISAYTVTRKPPTPRVLLQHGSRMDQLAPRRVDRGG